MNTTATAPETPKNKAIMHITIKDKAVLYASYMPFLKNGGVFIPTKKQHKLGDEVFVLLTLMDEEERYPISCTVVWITPVGAQGNRPAGVGVHFDEKFAHVKNKIETYLAGALNSSRPTSTI